MDPYQLPLTEIHWMKSEMDEMLQFGRVNQVYLNDTFQNILKRITFLYLR